MIGRPCSRHSGACSPGPPRRRPASVAAWARQPALQLQARDDGDGFVIDGRSTPALAARVGPAAAPLHRRPRTAPAHGARPAARCADAAVVAPADGGARARGLRAHGAEHRRRSTTDARGDALAGDVPEVALGASKTCAALRGVVEPAHEGPAWLEGSLGEGLERDLEAYWTREPPFVLMTCAAGSICACSSPAGRGRRRRDARPVRDRGRRRRCASAASAATSRALDRHRDDRLADAPAGRALPRSARSGARALSAYLPSSILAIALRCTSSGPSAKRSVRAPV